MEAIIACLLLPKPSLSIRSSFIDKYAQKNPGCDPIYPQLLSGYTSLKVSVHKPSTEQKHTDRLISTRVSHYKYSFCQFWCNFTDRWGLLMKTGLQCSSAVIKWLWLPRMLKLSPGYWPSYNVPFHQKIYSLSGYEKMWREYGDEFSYDLCPRAKIFRRDQGGVTDLASLKHIMRYNGNSAAVSVASAF